MKHFLSSLLCLFAIATHCFGQVSSGYLREIHKADELVQANKMAEAIEALQRAIEINPQISTAYMSLGNLYIAQKKFTEAVTSYQKACDLSPWDAFTFNSLGSAYLIQGKYAAAVEPLEAAFEISPELPNLKENLLILYQKLGQQKKADQLIAQTKTASPPTAKQLLFKGKLALYLEQDSNKALVFLQQALALEPNIIEAKYSLIEIYLAQRNYKEALTLLEEIKSFRGLDANGYLTLGRAYQRLKQTDAAMEAFQQLVNRVPDHLEALENLGEYFYEANQLEKARPFLERAIQVAPRAPKSYATLASIYNAMKRKEECFALLRKLTVIAPDDILYFQVLGYALLGDGQMEEGINVLKRALLIQPDHKDIRDTLNSAIAALPNVPNLGKLQEAVRQNPNSWQAHLNLASAYKRLGKSDEAFLAYQAAYTLSPTNFDAMLYYASGLSTQKRYAEALKVFQDFYQNKPDAVEGHFYQANIYFELKQYPEAINHYSKVMEAKPDANFSALSLAICYEEIEEWDKAIQVLEQLLKHVPADAKALNELAILYFNKNRTRDAYQLLERLKKVNPGLAESLRFKFEGK